jgi:CheY-like chemotaxis protein
MSHEIRTPLNGVLGMLSLSLENETHPEQQNRMEIALNAGQSLLGLLNDILDISKVEAGKLSLETIPFSVRNLVEECTTLHAQQARSKQIDVVADIDGHLPETFLGDPTRTRQVLNNLLSNAIKFTDQGCVRLAVTHVKGNVRFDIVDTGIGMSKEGLHRIFSPFSQADADTTRLYGGTGLGLTLCRQLVERMHGQILVDSEQNRGTHFTVNLPLPVEDQGLQDVLESKVPETLKQAGVDLALSNDHPHFGPICSQLEAWNIPVRAAAPGNHGVLVASVNGADDGFEILPDDWGGAGVLLIDRFGKNTRTNGHPHLSMPLRRDQLLYALCSAAGLQREDIGESSAIDETSPAPGASHSARTMRFLLVEDNHVNQLVASSMLKKLGHEVVVADQGQRALDILATDDNFDMVLMDCQMPVLDGYETTQIIRRNPDWKKLPIIAVTANVMQGDRDDCLASGMDDYITKPYNRADLKTIIERWTPAVR